MEDIKRDLDTAGKRGFDEKGVNGISWLYCSRFRVLFFSSGVFQL